MIYNYLILADTLNSKGFIIIDSNVSENFDDYYIIYSNTKINITFTGDRSSEYIDINLCEDEEEKFDLSLIRTIIMNNNDLTNSHSIKELCDFLNSKIETILNLFDTKKYKQLKNKLKALEQERARKLFG